MDGREKMFFYVASGRTEEFLKTVAGFDPRFDEEKRRWQIDIASGEKSAAALVVATKAFGWQSPGFFEATKERIAGVVAEGGGVSKAEKAAGEAMAREAGARRVAAGPVQGPLGIEEAPKVSLASQGEMVAAARQRAADWECIKSLQAGAANKGLWFQSTFMANGFMLPGRGGGREAEIEGLPGAELRKAMWRRGTSGEVGGRAYAKRDIGLALMAQASVPELRVMMARNSELHEQLWEKEDKGRFLHAIETDPGWKASVSARVSRLGADDGMAQGLSAFRSLPFEEAKRLGGESVLTDSERNRMVGLDNGWKAIRAAAATFKGPVKVDVQRKSKAPPRPYDLPSLQKAAGSKFGWTAQRTLDAAQSLYEVHKITTYPPGECRYLPESMIPDAQPLLADLKHIPDYRGYALQQPQIRKGKSGLYSDKQLEGFSHHAIIPNVNCPAGIAATAARLTGDDKILLDLIARAFLAAIGDDKIYDATTLSADVPTPAPSPRLFKANGAVVVKAGWLAILSDPDEDEDGAVPPLKNGETVAATKATVEARQTKPPPRYSEGALIEAMQNAWKFISDPAERDRLKDSKGIGTPATRGTVIEELKRQNLLTPDASRKFIVPTEAGLALYTTFLKHAPALLDPGSTARMETRLDDVAAGRTSADTVIREMADNAAAIIPRLQTAGKTDKIDNAAQARPKLSATGKISATRPGASKPGAPKPVSATAAKPRAGKPVPHKAAPTKPAASASPAKVTPAGTALNVLYDRREEVKALGARWDGEARVWRAPPGVDLSPFRAKGFLV